MNYRSITDLNDAIVRNLNKLPQDIDLVVGIPRSGLLAANLMSLALNIPVTDVEGFIAGRILASGRTRRHAKLEQQVKDARTIVVLDDSICRGKSMQEARTKLAGYLNDARIIFCAVYGLRDDHEEADVVLETVAHPRMFQWNVMHHKLLEKCCVDIDGVLCCDPPSRDNDDGTRYKRFLLDATPMHVPTQRIGWLVTSRLEKYRELTEAWLSNHGIEYDELIMLDLPSAEERRRLGAHGTFKADVYRRLEAILFIESEHLQAAEIARLSRKPVLCMETQCVVPASGECHVPVREFPVVLPTRIRHPEAVLPVSRKPVATLLKRVVGRKVYHHLRHVILG